MKRVLSMVLAFLFTVTVLPVAFAESDSLYLTYRVQDGEAIITGCSSNEEEIILPETVDGYPVTTLDLLSFISDTVKRIHLPASVVSIYWNAFAQCYSLEQITVDEKNPVYSAVAGVLFNKEGTALVYYPRSKPGATYEIPDGVTAIGEGGFDISYYLTGIHFPASLTEMAASALYFPRNITAFTVDENNPVYTTLDGVLVSKDQTRLIRYPTGREDIVYTVPEGITHIGANSFRSNRHIQAVVLPEGVTHVESAAFFSCSSLAGANIPDSMIHIADAAFSGTVYEGSYYGDTTYYIDNALIKADCDWAGEFIVRNDVDLIAGGAFRYCYYITDVVLPEGVKRIGDATFESCDGLTYWTVPNGITEVGDRAFAFCENLTALFVPKSVTTIGVDAFRRCDNLTLYTGEGTAAAAYAAENNIPLILCDFGNLNENEHVDAKDALSVLQAAVGRTRFTEEQQFCADVSGDNVINAIDALLILQYAVGKRNAFPVEA